MRRIGAIGLLGLGIVLSAPAAAAVGAAEAARLGQQLTPVGAQKAASAYAADAQPEATRSKVVDEFAEAEDPATRVPEWDASPAGVEADKPLFTISAVNAGRYREHLTESHFSLLQTYSNTYFMKVYPSRRTVRWPREIEAASKANATSCSLQGTDELSGCRLGFPFPLPQNGAEAIWNHKLRWRGDQLSRVTDQLIVQATGKFQVTSVAEDFDFRYADLKSGLALKADQREFARYLGELLEPPRLAGHYLLVHDRTGSGASGRTAWSLTPSSKRVRREPKACCDNPVEGSDALQFHDQVDMFSGPLEVYSWKLLGKRDAFIPYNAQRLAAAATRHAEIVLPAHLNQDLLRYELHRVWVVEAALRPSYGHTLRKRRFYLDEDSWMIVAVDMLDNYDQPYQFQEGHLLYSAATQRPEYAAEVLYNLSTERYFVTGLRSAQRTPKGATEFAADYFEPAALNRRNAGR